MQSITLRRDPYFYAAIVLAAVVLSIDLLLPLGFDNDIYQSMGWTLTAYHGLPYIASWDHNFPGIALVHATSIALFGNSDLGFRALDLILHTAGAGLYFALLRRWFSSPEALMAVLLSALYYAAGAWELAGQRDGFAVIALLATSLLYFRCCRSKTPALLLVVAGVCIGLAVMMRPTYVLFGAALIVHLRHKPNLVANACWLALGITLPWILYLTPYLFIHGGLTQVYYCIIRFNTDLYTTTKVPINLWSRGRVPLYIASAAGVSVAAARSRRKGQLVASDHDAEFIVLVSLCSLISLVAMGKYFQYHFEPLMVILIAFATYAIWCGLRWMPSTGRIIVCILLLAVYGYAYYPKHLARYYYEGRNTAHPLEYAYEAVLSDSLIGLKAQDDVVAYVNSHCSPAEAVEYVSLFPNLRWRLARPMATRFTAIHALVYHDANGGHPEFQRAWQNEFLNKLATVRPHYIILLTGHHIWWGFANDFADHMVHEIPGFDSLLATGYQTDTTLHGFTIYRIKP